MLHHFLGFPVRTFELSFSESSILKESKTVWCVKFFGGLGVYFFVCIVLGKVRRTDRMFLPCSLMRVFMLNPGILETGLYVHISQVVRLPSHPFWLSRRQQSTQFLAVSAHRTENCCFVPAWVLQQDPNPFGSC